MVLSVLSNKQDILQGGYKFLGVISAYSNALWWIGRIRLQLAHYNIVDGIDEIYLGHPQL